MNWLEMLEKHISPVFHSKLAYVYLNEIEERFIQWPVTSIFTKYNGVENCDMFGFHMMLCFKSMGDSKKGLVYILYKRTQRSRLTCCSD